LTLLAKERSLEESVTIVVSEYDVSVEKAEKDLSNLIQELLRGLG